MRTTIDLPDKLMKKVKIVAIEEGITLKELFTRTLEKELSEGMPDPKSVFELSQYLIKCDRTLFALLHISKCELTFTQFIFSDYERIG